MKLKIVDKDTFNKYALKHPLNNLQQNSYWAEAEAFYGWNAQYLLFFDAQNIVAGTMVLIKKWKKFTKLYAPRGILIDYDNKDLLKEVYVLLKQFVKKNKGIFLKIEPYIQYQERSVDGDILGKPNTKYIDNLISSGFKHTSFKNDNKLSNNRFITLLNIKDKTYDEIYKEFTNKCKSNIKKAQDNFIDVRNIQENELDAFCNTVASSAEYHSFHTPSLSYLTHLYNLYVKNGIGEFAISEMNVSKLRESYDSSLKDLKIKLEEYSKATSYKEKMKKKELEEKILQINNRLKEIEPIKKDKIILSASIFITIGKTMYYFLSGNNRDYINFNGSYIMQNEYIKKAIDNHLNCYNFLGISGIFDKTHPRYGVINFKRGFNSEVIEFVGEFIIIGNKTGYQLNELINKISGLKTKYRKAVK